MSIKIKSPKESVAVINMNKATFHAYIFHLFYGAGYACLLPFFSLYLRYLGLTAAQVGMVFGAKAAVNMIWAPCWTRCSTKFRKKRFVLMFSMFILLGTFGLMIIIPPANRELSNLQFCDNPDVNITEELNTFSDVLAAEMDNDTDAGATTSEGYRDMAGDVYNLDDDTWEILKKYGMDPAKLKETDKASLAKIIDGIIKDIEVQKSKETRVKRYSNYYFNRKTQNRKQKGRVHSPEMEVEPTLEDPTDLEDEREEEEKVEEIIEEETDSASTSSPTTTPTSSPTTSVPVTTSTQLVLETSSSPSDVSPSSPSSAINPSSTTPPSSLLNYLTQDNLYDSFASIMNRIHELPGQINTVIYEKVFAAVMALIIVGEMFSAPAEKLADDTWFEFLDSSDVLEKYGTHKMWLALGAALVPPALTAGIDRLPCMLPQVTTFEMPRIFLHFFAFFLFMGLAFFCSICFPIFSTIDGKKVLQRRGRFCRGLRTLFNDVSSSMFTISVLIMGFVYGATNTFLFWLMQDLGSVELLMGLSVASAYGGEFFMQGVGRWLVSKIGYAVCMTFGLLVLGGRLVFYSFVWDPLLVIACEGLHCLSISLIWASVRTYPDFRLNPLVMDRSANSVMNSFYHGLGLAPGCFIAGHIYDWVGLPILYQSCAVLVGAWAIIFAIVQCCTRKPQKVRYAKLLQDEEDADGSDGSMEYDDDWLEVAMKHQH